MAAAFTRQDLLDLAGLRLFERGLACVDAVADLRLEDGALLATVHDREPYPVRLGVGPEGLSGRCACPEGDGGQWCAHMVAVGLAKLDGVGGGDDGDLGDGAEHPLYDYLSGLDHDTLVDLLVEAAEEDEELGDRLRADAVRHALQSAAQRVAEGEGELRDIPELNHLVVAAMSPDWALDTSGAQRYAEQVEGVVELIGAVLDADQAAAALHLCEQAIGRFRALAGTAADPSSEELAAGAEGLAQLHLEACESAGAPAPALGRWLAECHATQELGVPCGLDAYGKLLGEAGLAAYADALTTAWAARAPERSDYTLTRRMEQLYAVVGDTDALVDVLATDLGSPGRYLRIAEVLAAAGRADDALAWAERGLAATPDGRAHDERLLTFAVDHHQRAGRGGEAVALRRRQFSARPGADEFRALQAAALAAAGADGWSEQRAWALGELRERAARRSARSWESPAAPLIDLLVAVGDLDGAWEAAIAFAAGHPALLRLARLRAAAHPADAVPVFRAEVDLQIEGRSRESFRAAVDWIERIRDLYQQLGTPEATGRLLAEIRGTHAAQGSLLAELDARGL
jgi:uncharacterized Zn finger protein